MPARGEAVVERYSTDLFCDCWQCVLDGSSGKYWSPRNFRQHVAASAQEQQDELARLAAMVDDAAAEPGRPGRDVEEDQYMNDAFGGGADSEDDSDKTASSDSSSVHRIDIDYRAADLGARVAWSADDPTPEEEVVGEDGDDDSPLDGAPATTQPTGASTASASRRPTGPLHPEEWVPPAHDFDPEAGGRDPLAPDGTSRPAPTGRTPSLPDSPLNRLLYQLVAIMRIAFRISRRRTDFILRAIKILLLLLVRTLKSSPQTPQDGDDDPGNSVQVTAAVETIPKDSRTVISKLGLATDILQYPLCPNDSCRHIYPLNEYGPLPPTCTAAKGAKGVTCGTALLRPDDQKPIQSLAYRPVIDYIRSMYARSELAPFLHRIPLDASSKDQYLRDFIDGRIFQTLRAAPHQGPQEHLFFSQPHRLSLSLYYDGVSVNKGTTSNVFSIGVLFVTLNNLPLGLRYKPRNVGLLAVLPGPREFPGPAFKQVIQIVVEEFKLLWRGVDVDFVPPATDPLLDARHLAQEPSRLRRVYGLLQNVLGDRPAQTKVMGSSGHMSSTFCPLDDASASVKSHPDRSARTAEYSLDALNHSTDATRREAMRRYQEAPSEAARKKIAEVEGVNWTPLVELPYFDVARGGAFDPAHVLNLGLPRWHHLSLHVQTGLYDESLELFPYMRHLLAQVVTPRDLGRVPTKLSLAGGSTLKADTWRCYTESFSVYALYHILWEGPTDRERAAIERETHKPRTARPRKETASNVDPSRATGPPQGDSGASAAADAIAGTGLDTLAEWLTSSVAEVDGQDEVKRNARRRDFQDQWKSRIRDATEAERHALRVRSFDAWCLFVRCSRLALRHSMTPAEAAQAADLGARYARQLVEIFGPDATAPNHHYLLHIFELVMLHGPAHATWTLPQERLNGIISAIPTNAHPGELETTLLREFLAMGHLDALQSSSNPRDSVDDREQDEMMNELRRATRDERGAVAALMQANAGEDPYATCRLGPLTEGFLLDEATYAALLDYLNGKLSPFQTGTRFISDLTASPGPDETPVPHYHRASATASIRGHTVSQEPESVDKRDSSLVQAFMPDGRLRICRIATLFRLELDIGGAFTVSLDLAIVKWATAAQLAGPGTEKARALAAEPQLGITLLEPDAYEPPSAHAFLPLDRIKSRCVYAPARVGGRAVTWAVTMERS